MGNYPIWIAVGVIAGLVVLMLLLGRSWRKLDVRTMEVQFSSIVYSEESTAMVIDGVVYSGTTNAVSLEHTPRSLYLSSTLQRLDVGTTYRVTVQVYSKGWGPVYAVVAAQEVR